MTTYRISTPDNPGHTTGADLVDAVMFANELGYDMTLAETKLKKTGRLAIKDDVGEIIIEAEEPV